MMDCTRARELLPEYGDGRLGSVQASALREHLEGCIDCRRQEALLEGTWNLLRHYPEISADLLTAVRRRTRGPIVRILRIAAPIVAAAAVLLVIFFVAGSTPSVVTDDTVNLEIGQMPEEDRALLLELAENRELIENMELLRSLELIGADRLTEDKDPFNGH